MRLFLGLVLLGLAFSAVLIALGALLSLEPGPAAAVALGLLIAFLGVWFLRAVARGGPKEAIPPEDVADLDVFFVCRECGTEFRVEKIGEVQVPRHCGEPMRVERRPRSRPS